MAVLLEGQGLALSSRPHRTKSVVYFKLTDSAEKALEELARQKGSDINSSCPTIQFRNSGGVIVVPNAGKDKTERFGFSVSKTEDGGSFQCLKSTSHGSLESMGTMRETIRIKANEDVFQRTIQRQHEAKRESEKKTTVLLESKDKKKVSIPRPGVVKKNNVVNSTQSRHFPSALTSSGPSFSGPGRGMGPTRPAGPRPPSPDPMFARQSEAKKNYPSKSYPNSEIIKRPVRDRLIHLLAVKPYKKIELLPRLHKDGIKDKDKKSVMIILREVSELKNNCYELKRSVWNDVMEDWPFYTESDKAALRRRKPQNLTPPVSDTGSTSSGHSPSSTNPASPPQITNPLKRTSYYEQSAENAAKKKRVSRFKRTEPISSSSAGSSSGGGYSRSPYGISGSSPMIGTGVSPRLGVDHVSPKQPSMDRLDLPANFEDESAPDWGQFHDNDQPAAAPAPVITGRNSPERKNSPAVAITGRSPAVTTETLGTGFNSPKRSIARTNSPCSKAQWTADVDQTVSSSSSSPQLNMQFHFQNANKDFLTHFSPIANAEQRAQYKREFNAHYNKYIEYHRIIDKVRARFTQLESSLSGAERGSEQYMKIKSDILTEYERNKMDQSYQDARHNFQYLHEKLKYLKKLVHDYDTKQQHR